MKGNPWLTRAGLLAAEILGVGGAWLTDLAPPLGGSVNLSVGMATVLCMAVDLVVVVLVPLGKKRPRTLRLVAGIATLGGIIVGLWTAVVLVQYGNRYIYRYPEKDGILEIAGSELIPETRQVIARIEDREPGTVDRMRKSDLRRYGDAPGDIWTADSIERVQRQLILSYFLAVLGISVALAVPCEILLVLPGKTPAARPGDS